VWPKLAVGRRWAPHRHDVAGTGVVATPSPPPSVFPLGPRPWAAPPNRASLPALAVEADFDSGPADLVGRPVRQRKKMIYVFHFHFEKRNAWEKCCVSILYLKIVKQIL
jgi:hypothetical protein